MSNHLLSKVLRFHYHSQKVIGSLGIENPTAIILDFSVDDTDFVSHSSRTPKHFLGNGCGSKNGGWLIQIPQDV